MSQPAPAHLHPIEQAMTAAALAHNPPTAERELLAHYEGLSARLEFWALSGDMDGNIEMECWHEADRIRDRIRRYRAAKGTP